MPSPLRVLWVCGSGVAGGAENTSLQLVSLLRERGHDVTALCRPGGDVERMLRSASLPHRSASLGGALNLRAAWSIARAMRDLRPDVVLVTTADEWVWSCLIPRRRGSRLVLVRYMALPLPRRVQRLANRADAVVAVSEAVRRSLVHVAAERIRVIRVPWRFAPRAAVASPEERASVRRRLGLPGGAPLVGFFGGLREEKGLFDVLHAVRRAAQHMSREVHLLVCGPAAGGVGRTALDERIARLGMASRVHVLGWVADVRQPLTAADVVLLATHRTLGEALPLVLLDAMACGTPVAAYGVGGAVEAVGADGEAGRLAAPDDPDDLGRVLAEILADPEAAAAMAARALRRLGEEFDPQASADLLERLLADLHGAEKDPSRS